MNLTEISRRRAAVTPGRWRAEPPRPFGGNTEIVVEREVDSDRWIVTVFEPGDASFIAHAPGDVADLLAVLEPLAGYLHHDQPVEVLAEVVQAIRESHERIPFITEDWASERQDREFYEGMLRECEQVIGPKADGDPALRELAGRLRAVLADEDQDAGPIIGG
jgi:hypothetical protein